MTQTFHYLPQLRAGLSPGLWAVKSENCDFKVPCSKVKLNSLEAFFFLGLVFKMLAAKCTRASSLEKKHQLHICTFICTLGRNESCLGCAWPETVLVTLLIAHPELGEALSSCKDVFPEGLCILSPWERGALPGQGPQGWMLQFTVPYSHLAGLGEASGLGEVLPCLLVPPGCCPVLPGPVAQS